MPGANRLHFRPGQNDSGLKFFQQEIVMRSDPVNSGIAFAGGRRVAAGIFLQVWLRLMCGLASHLLEKRYHNEAKAKLWLAFCEENRLNPALRTGFERN